MGDSSSELHFSRGQSLRVKGDAATVAAAVWPPEPATTVELELERANGGIVFVNPDQVLYISP